MTLLMKEVFWMCNDNVVTIECVESNRILIVGGITC